MYMPYLHGKQEELFSVIELGALGPLVVPIIKPVNLDGANVRRIARIAAVTRLAVITNSDKGRPGQMPTYAASVAALADQAITPYAANVFPAFELRGNSTLPQLTVFATEYAGRTCVLIHKSHTFDPTALATAMVPFAVPPVHVFVEPGVASNAYVGLPSAARVLVRDGFDACQRNSDYPRQSAFDDLAYQYRARSFDGFGDFCMIGDRYSSGGGPALAVALHVTEDTGQALLMNHFVSVSVGVDVPTMYFEAVDDLAANVGIPPRAGMGTLGIASYLASSTARNYSGLGPAKRWGAMHHIETARRIIQASGVAASF
ncbi:MAG: sce7725 family protein [Coriobacteriia bacterium]|nr:sce7725 family protein [Coriobacteriia bacterium]